MNRGVYTEEYTKSIPLFPFDSIICIRLYGYYLSRLIIFEELIHQAPRNIQVTKENKKYKLRKL